MSEKTWLGGIYMKDEGGYEIIHAALSHYIKRLKNIATSPEIADSPMFVQIIQQEANKNGPRAVSLLEKISNSLSDPALLQDLQTDIDLFQKSLESYKADIAKAMSGNQYYSNLLQKEKQNSEEISKAEIALQKINQFLDN